MLRQLAPDDSLPAVLVVDNEPAVRQVVATVLARWGIPARTARDGIEAVELFHRHHDMTSMVLLDVRMAGRDGPQTLELLREIDPTVRCWFMTTSAAAYPVEELLARGASGVLPKPLDLTTLRKLVTNA